VSVCVSTSLKHHNDCTDCIRVPVDLSSAILSQWTAFEWHYHFISYDTVFPPPLGHCVRRDVSRCVYMCVCASLSLLEIALIIGIHFTDDWCTLTCFGIRRDLIFDQTINDTELTSPFGIVQELAMVKTIVIRRVILGMI
jgi:hypothetical protein